MKKKKAAGTRKAAAGRKVKDLSARKAAKGGIAWGGPTMQASKITDVTDGTSNTLMGDGSVRS